MNSSSGRHQALMIDAHAHVVSAERAAANRAAGGPPAIDQAVSLDDVLAAQPWPIPLVVVESNRPHPGENSTLLELAAHRDEVLGVIGRLDLNGPDPLSEYEALLGHPGAPKWRGLRMSLLPSHGDKWSDAVRDLTRALGESGRALEMLATGDALAHVAEISEDAQCTVVLDHLGLPPWSGSDEEWQEWRTHMTRLARSTSVVCKWSALPARNVDGQQARADEATELAFDLFGPARLMYASNMPWPPGLTDPDDLYPVERAMTIAAQLPSDHAEALLGGTCRRAYGLLR